MRMRMLPKRHMVAVTAAVAAAILISVGLTPKTFIGPKPADPGEVMTLAKGISAALASAGEKAALLPTGPLNDRMWQELRRLNPTLPPLEDLGRIVDMVHADVDRGGLRGYAVLIHGRNSESGFLAATADGVYSCSGWWSGCVPVR